MMQSLPAELWLHVLRHVEPLDLVNVCMTCRDFYDLTKGHLGSLRALKNAMAKSEIPVPLALLDVPNMTANKLKRLAVSASGTLNFWSALRSTIASVTTVDGNVDDGSNAERMVLLPGGAFVLMIGNDGSPTLFRVDSAAPPRGGDSPFGRGPSDGRPRQEPRPIKHHVFHAPDGRLQILVGRDYDVSVYNIDLQDVSLRHVVTFSSGGARIAYATANGDILVLAVHEGGDSHPPLRLQIRLIPPHPQSGTVTPIGCNAPFPFLRGSVIRVVDRNHLLAVTSITAWLWVIPPLREDCDTETVSDWVGGRFIENLFIDRIHTKFQHQISPVAWSEPPGPDGPKTHPVYVFNGRMLHTFDPSLAPDTVAWAVRRFALPGTEADGARPLVSAAALGRRVLLWIDPRAPLEADDEITIDVAALPDHSHKDETLPEHWHALNIVGLLRSSPLRVPVRPGDRVLDLTFDEWTGRICLFLENPLSGRRALVVDVA